MESAVFCSDSFTLWITKFTVQNSFQMILIITTWFAWVLLLFLFFSLLVFFLFSSYLPPLASVTRCWSVVSVRWHHPTWTPHSVDLQAAGCWWGLGSRLHGRHLHWADPTGWSIAAPHPIAGRRRWPFLRRRCSIGQWSGTAQPLPFDSDWFLGWPAS